MISGAQVATPAELVTVLLNETWLQLLNAMARVGERCVSDLASDVGLSVQAVTNQVTRLVDQRIVVARRDGTRLYYTVVDPCVATLLDRGLCVIEDAWRGGCAATTLRSVERHRAAQPPMRSRSRI